MRLIDADALRNVKAPSICWLCGNHAQLSISDLVDNAPNVPRIAELQAEVERLKAEQGCEDGECRLALMAEVEALREENDLLGQPAPIATLRAEVERLNSMLKMKQDDWIAACKEAEQAEAEVERLRTWLGERHAYYRKEYADTFSNFDLGCAEAYEDVLIEMEERE